MEQKELRRNFLTSIYDASVEILGRQEADRLFVSAFGWTGTENESQSMDANFLADLSDEFSIKFHRNTARGLLIRIGDAAFSFLRLRIGELNALGTIENRLKPPDERFKDAMIVLAEKLGQAVGTKISLSSPGDDSFCLDISGGGERFSSDLYLYFLAGVLRAFGTWLDSRKDYTLAVESGETDDAADRVCLIVQAAQ